MNNTTTASNEQVLKACIKYLIEHNYADVQTIENPVADLLAFNDDTAVLFAVYASQDDLEEVLPNRGEAEAAMFDAMCDETIGIGHQVRFDTIGLRPNGNKALLKHHINALF